MTPPDPRFSLNLTPGGDPDGTVTDNLTGLIWLRDTYVGEIKVVTLPQALAAINELNTSGTMNGADAADISNAGSHQTDWRLPNINELRSLVSFGHGQPAIATVWEVGPRRPTRTAPF